MPPKLRPQPFLVGQKPQRTFRNKYTKYFFNELDKGITSPYILFFTGGLFSLLCWRITEHYIEPRQAQLAQRKMVPRVPLEESHNQFWGLGSRELDSTRQDPGTTVALGEVHSGNIYSPQTADVEGHEDSLRRPQLIHSEPSELRERASAVNPTGEVDIVCLELPEYDPKLKDDIYYRSLHYIPFSSTKSAKDDKKKDADKESKKTAGSDEPATKESYLQFVPGQGEEVIHGIVKCKGVTPENNCIPYAGHMEDELSRKFALTLGPVHILRDAAQSLMPYRFTFVKQVPVETLVIGLHDGGLCRWLSSAFPNFNLEVVEPDGALVRICRRFLGFKESSNLKLWVGDPKEYVRHMAAATIAKDSAGNTTAAKGVKRYDLVLINAIDGSGHLNPDYGRLEFVSSLRNAMSNSGCVAVALPNMDGKFVYNMVQNWRMAFSGKTVVLVHCMTSPVTLLMTFQDAADRGKANVGSVANVDEFKDILRAHLKHYGPNRVPFDLTHEVNKENFSVLDPQQTYPLSRYLPRGHPDIKKYESDGTSPGKKKEGWNAWIRRLAGQQLTAGQRADLSR